MNHPIYDSIKTREHMKIFMESHVWFVLDFMTLLKGLKKDITLIHSDIWLPSGIPEITRFVNEINIGEESDLFKDGTYISHFELYLLAMDQVGADRTEIDLFVEKIKNGAPYHRALYTAKISQAVKNSVDGTINTAIHDSLLKKTAYFFLGREDAIPIMFTKFLSNIPNTTEFTYLRHYLARHIEVDADDHGPKANLILDYVTKKDPEKIEEALMYGVSAIDFRIKVWDDIFEKINYLNPCYYIDPVYP